MALLDKILGKFGFTRKTYTWGQLFETAKEMGLILGDTVNNPFKQVASVFKAIKAIADNIPQAELVFKDWSTEKETVNAELEQLFDNPNPVMSRNDFMQACAGFYALYGELAIIKQASIGQIIGTKKLPAELYPVNPKNLEPIYDKNSFPPKLNGWKYGNATFSPEEVIFAKDFNPDNYFKAIAPTEPIAKHIDIDWKALLFNKAFFENHATLGTVLTTPSDKSLTESQRKRLEEWVKQHYRGVSKGFKTIVLEGGMDAKVIGTSHSDMQFIEQSKFTREEILGIWRVPKALFNITDDLNYATFVGQMKIFWLYGLMPILRKIEEAFNRHLIYPATDRKIYCQFDYKNVPAFQEDYKEKVSTAKILYDMGFTANEVNEKLELGFDKKEWRDYWWIPFSMVKAGEEVNLPTDNSNSNNNDNSQDDSKSVNIISNSKAPNIVIWKQFVSRHILLEMRLAKSIKTFFYEQRRRLLSNVNGKSFTKDSSNLMDWSFEDEQFKKKIAPIIYVSIGQGTEIASGLVPSEVNPDILRARMQGLLKTKLERIGLINSVTRKDLDKIILDGLSQGLSVQELSDQIRQYYNRMDVARSRRIARTETTGAINGGSMLYYRESGVSKKQWVTAGDENVRASHASLNGEIVRSEQSFSNGLEFPGDDGSPEEVINCRCTIIPIFD